MKLKGNEIISEAGDELATLNKGVLRMKRGHASERPVVEKWLRENGYLEDPAADPAPVPDEQEAIPGVERADDLAEDIPMPEDPQAPPVEDVPEVTGILPRSAVAGMKVPPEKPAGDKDPLVVAWYFHHERGKFLERYGQRKGKNLEPYLEALK